MSKATFNWKKWLFILIAIIVIPILIRYIYKQYQKWKALQEDVKQTNDYNANQNPTTVQNKRDKITVRKDVQQDAIMLAHHLGTKYSDVPFDFWDTDTWGWANPKGWTENDKEAADILIRERLNYSYLQKLYYETETNKRNLTNDIISLLDKSELQRVQKYIKLT